MLDSLAQLYVRGAKVDWAGFDRPYAATQEFRFPPIPSNARATGPDRLRTHRPQGTCRYAARQWPRAYIRCSAAA